MALMTMVTHTSWRYDGKGDMSLSSAAVNTSLAGDAEGDSQVT